MELICKPGGCGKTCDLIMESARTGTPILLDINAETVTYTPDSMNE